MARNDVTYEQVVRMWRRERETLGRVQPYTAKRGAQKALLFAPWIGAKTLARVRPAMI